MSCLRCGNCCDEVAFFVDKNRTDIEWVKLHGFVVEDRGNEWRIMIKAQCSAKIDNKCSIYETRPEICKNFRCEKNVLNDYPDLKGSLFL